MPPACYGVELDNPAAVANHGDLSVIQELLHGRPTIAGHQEEIPILDPGVGMLALLVGRIALHLAD
jgi:hypothetical protein